MSGDLIRRLLRRAAVLGATVAVIAAAAGTVKVAADWRAAAAPLDTAPAGMDSISAEFVSETDRTSVLTGQVDDVASQLTDLQAAVEQANGQVGGDAKTADQLRTDLAAAKAKLATLQGQLKAAQARLAALNRAAARQAALNASKPAATSGGYSDDHEGEHDDD